MLKLDGVVTAYDDVICLRGVSLEVRRGGFDVWQAETFLDGSEQDALTRGEEFGHRGLARFITRQDTQAQPPVVVLRGSGQFLEIRRFIRGAGAPGCHQPAFGPQPARQQDHGSGSVTTSSRPWRKPVADLHDVLV